MNLRTYLTLEKAFATRLVEEWRQSSVPVYAQIASACERGDYDHARDLSNDLNLADIGSSNREFIKYQLLSFSIFGAGMAAKGTPQFLGTNYDQLLNHVTDNVLASLNYGGTAAVRGDALQSIARLENAANDQEWEGAVAKLSKAEAVAEPPRYVKPFQSFAGAGESTLQLITSLNGSRMASWGFVAEADARTIKRYRLSPTLDGRTSPFCTMLGERDLVFEVDDARGLVNDALSVQDPNDLRVVQPWPGQSKAAIEDYRRMSAEQLVREGLQIPPYHPHCRTIVVAIDGPQRGGSKLPPIQMNTPPFIATPDTFAELGTTMQPAEVDHWNKYVGLNPVDVAASLTAQTGGQVLMDETSTGIAIDGYGVVKINNTAKFKSTMADQSVSYDPYASVVSVDQLDLYGGDTKDQADYLTNFLNKTIKYGKSVGAHTMTINVGTHAYEFAKMGFHPTDSAWHKFHTSWFEAQVKIGELHDLIEDLSPNQKDVLDLIMGLETPEAAQLVARLPWTVGNEEVGKVVLKSFFGDFELDLSDPQALAQVEEYVGDTSEFSEPDSND